MTILRPSTTTSLVIRLAWRIEAAGISYFALMPESVSPATTVWLPRRMGWMVEVAESSLRSAPARSMEWVRRALCWMPRG